MKLWNFPSSVTKSKGSQQLLLWGLNKFQRVFPGVSRVEIYEQR